MVKTILEQAASFGGEFVALIPPGVFLAFSTAFIENGKYMRSFRQEFVGTILMVVCTFSAGKWVGKESVRISWLSHALGVISADYFGGGPHVNPAVTVSMFTLGKCSYTDSFVRIAAQLCGGLVAFPIFHEISNIMKWEAFGGPEFNMDKDDYATAEAFLSEFCATTLLMFIIYILNWELHFGKHHYIIKQTLTAAAIRFLIEFFPTAGPSMNPMLATTWYVFGVGKLYEYPKEFEHYFVYWIAPMLAAILASVLYGIYNGDKIFGYTLPIGPMKKRAPIAAEHRSSKDKRS